MASRSLNKVLLIGNLTRDPELRYTPSGAAVCTFGLATNRQWNTEDGQKKEEAEFHNIVAWTRLAEICAQYLTRGKQAYVEGRLSTREWEGQDGQKRRTTEIIASEVIFLGSASAGAQRGEAIDVPDDFGLTPEPQESETKAGKPVDEDDTKPKAKPEKPEPKKEEGEDIPF